ncbi:hypothetical protein F4804DRAFT_342870 [Jackrogersella minutella]|nr:hypothetical protein F4804DRAFT_342870 [Jackrogersella minutella]
MLPRIMPAPQALLRVLRPRSLPSVEARVVKVVSGETLDAVGFFANAIHPLEDLPQYSIKVLSIARQIDTIPTKITCSNINPNMPGLAGMRMGFSAERIRKTATVKRYDYFRELINTFIPFTEKRLKEYVPVVLLSPLNVILFLSFLLTIGLVVAGCLWNDGTAVIAIALLSIASSIIGYGAWWTPRTNFLVIKCTKTVSHELYSGSQKCDYKFDGFRYRLFTIAGAILIMPSVILLGNCSFNMQLLCGASYMALDIVYWLRYTISVITPADTADYVNGVPSCGKTLWYAIREAKDKSWVERIGAVPNTNKEQWKQWLASELSQDHHLF